MDDHEARIDREWLAAERALHGHQFQPRPASAPRRRPARVPRRHAAAAQREPARWSGGGPGDDRTSQSRACDVLQQRIEALERRIADSEKAVALNADQRRMQQRHLARIRRQDRARARERLSADQPTPGPAPEVAVAEAEAGTAEPPPSSAASSSPPPPPPPSVAALGVLVARMAILASTACGPATSGWEHGPALSQAARVAGVTSSTWDELCGSAAKQRVDSAVCLQRAERGRVARRLARALARDRARLIAAFLEVNPEWRRMPSADDPAASVLPRLASGTRLGRGAFGCVYQPRPVWHFPHCGVAVKAVSLRRRSAARGLAHEATLLRRAHEAGPHPHVVGLHGAFLEGEHVRLALDLAAGDLQHQLWQRRGVLGRREALDLARQTASGLRHLHAAAGVAHRDLKLENLLLFGRGGGGSGGVVGRPLLKLADLGLGIHISQLTAVQALTATERERLPADADGACREQVGSPATMAPEVRGDELCWYCPFAADAWSLGACLLALLAPRDPDEFEARAPFYPFRCADAADDEFVAYSIDCESARLSRSPPRHSPPGLGLPPGLRALPPLGSASQLDAVGARTLAAPGPISRLLDRRARLYGLSVPDPPLPKKLLALFDGLLRPDPRLRSRVSDAAVSLMQLEAEAATEHESSEAVKQARCT